MVEAIRQGDIPGVQLRRRRRFEGVDRETVWSSLAEPERLRRWLSPRAEIELQAGGALRIGGDFADGGADTGEVVDVEPPQRLTLLYRRQGAGWRAATRVEIEITADGSGAEISVLHRGFENLPLSDCLTIWESLRRKWEVALGRLAEELGAA